MMPARRLIPPGFLPILAAALLGAGATAAAARPLTTGGKLLLTNGISTLDGAAGGGLAPWAVIAGNGTDDGIGAQAQLTRVVLRDYDYRGIGVAVGFRDRVELSFARQSFDTNRIGAALGLGRDYRFVQNVLGAKVRLAGDLVYGRMPAVALGAQLKDGRNDAVVRALGARADRDVDVYVSASRLLLAHSLLVNGTLRLTRANQLGLLGFGGDKGGGRMLAFEGSAAWQLSRRLAIGGEYRMKPDRLGIAREDDWVDLFAAWAVNRHVTVTIAYVDLGEIATRPRQRGVLVQLQAGF